MGISLRRPLKAAAERIKAIEDDYLMPLEAEQGRLESLAYAWHQSEQRRVAAEEARRQEELAAKLRDEQAAKALAAETGDAEAVAMAEQATAAVETALYAPKAEPVKVGGMSTRRVMRWELLDIRALAAARPELVKMEPKAAAILSTCFPEQPVPGLRLWYEDSTSTRKW